MCVCVCVPSKTSECGVDGETLAAGKALRIEGEKVSFGDKPVNCSEG